MNAKLEFQRRIRAGDRSVFRFAWENMQHAAWGPSRKGYEYECETHVCDDGLLDRACIEHFYRTVLTG